MAELITLRLEGLLQSWGEATAWDRRGTANFPTKSAITGLLGCAMGLARESAELPRMAQEMTIGIRADRSGTILSDYQTIHGMPGIRKANGDERDDPIVSPHFYLQDAAFLVLIETTEPWRQRIAAALDDPKWCLYLGRKNCVPSRPVWDGIHSEYADLEDALHRYPAAERADRYMSYEIEYSCSNTGALTRPDLPLGGRKFERRRVWRGVVRRDEGCI